MGAGTCVPLMKTISLCGVPAGPAAGAAANADDMRELLESIGLPQLHPLFEEEEMTDSSVLVQMLPRPEQLRQALKEVGVRKVGQREKIVAALKDMPSPADSAASDGKEPSTSSRVTLTRRYEPLRRKPEGARMIRYRTPSLLPCCCSYELYTRAPLRRKKCGLFDTLP